MFVRTCSRLFRIKARPYGIGGGGAPSLNAKQSPCAKRQRRRTCTSLLGPKKYLHVCYHNGKHKSSRIWVDPYEWVPKWRIPDLLLPAVLHENECFQLREILFFIYT